MILRKKKTVKRHFFSVSCIISENLLNIKIGEKKRKKNTELLAIGLHYLLCQVLKKKHILFFKIEKYKVIPNSNNKL